MCDIKNWLLPAYYKHLTATWLM